MELLKYLTREQAQRVKQLDPEKVEEHFGNEFYDKAREAWRDKQVNQVLKGAEKYPETFNPDHWTNVELFEHAAEELVDGWHYLVALKQRTSQLQTKLDRIGMLIAEDGSELANEIYGILEGLEVDES